MSSSESPVATVLFVPYSKTACTNPIRMNKGMRHANASQSSLNNFSVRIYLPHTRNRMMTAAKHVHHQHTSNVALLSRNGRTGGGELYIDMSIPGLARPVYLRRGDGGEEGSVPPRDYESLGTSCQLMSIPPGTSRGWEGVVVAYLRMVWHVKWASSR